jgi:hypothetical protein
MQPDISLTASDEKLRSAAAHTSLAEVPSVSLRRRFLLRHAIPIAFRRVPAASVIPPILSRFGFAARALLTYRRVSLAVGILLLVAAISKGHQLASDPVLAVNTPDWKWLLVWRSLTFDASTWLILGCVETELLLGLWLVSGIAPPYAWAIAVFFFSVLASGSLYLAGSGTLACGCFGTLQINSWQAFSIDVVALVALVFSRPKPAVMPSSVGDVGRQEPPELHLKGRSEETEVPADSLRRSAIAVESCGSHRSESMPGSLSPPPFDRGFGSTDGNNSSSQVGFER